MNNQIPKLTKVTVFFKYAAASGYRAELTIKSDADCPKPMTPNRTLAAAAAEIARISEIAGCGDDLALAVAEAIKAVREDRAIGQKVAA